MRRETIDSSLEQSTFGPNARGDAGNRWRDKVDVVLVRCQFGEIDLASRSHNLRIELIALLGMRVKPNDDLRFRFDIQGGLPLKFHTKKDRFEATTAVSELAAESNLDGGLLAKDAHDIGAGGGLSSIICLYWFECTSRAQCNVLTWFWGGLQTVDCKDLPWRASSLTCLEPHRIWRGMDTAIFYERPIVIIELEECVRFGPADHISPSRETGDVLMRSIIITELQRIGQRTLQHPKQQSRPH